MYNPKIIHNDNNENTRKTINPPSYPHCPQKKMSIFEIFIKENKNIGFGKCDEKREKVLFFYANILTIYNLWEKRMLSDKLIYDV